MPSLTGGIHIPHTLGNIGKRSILISEGRCKHIGQRRLCQLLGRQQNHPVIYRNRSRPRNVFVINIMVHSGLRNGGIFRLVPGKCRNQDTGCSQKPHNDAGCRLIYHRADSIPTEPDLQSQDSQARVCGNFSIHNLRAARISSEETRLESSHTSGTPCGKKGRRRSKGTTPPSRGT